MESLAVDDFDIIVTDLKMPGIDGMAIFEFARSRLPHAKIIMISGFATIDTVREALKVGVYDFVVKPFKISQLKDIVEKACKELAREEGHPE